MILRLIVIVLLCLFIGACTPDIYPSTYILGSLNATSTGTTWEIIESGGDVFATAIP
jgi:hypothetical protein